MTVDTCMVISSMSRSGVTHARTETLQLLQRCLPVTEGDNQKTAITLNQAAKLFTLLHLGAGGQTGNPQSGQDIDVKFRQISGQIDQGILSRSLGKWLAQFQSNGQDAARQLAQLGFMLLPDDGGASGNTVKTIDYYDTDKTLNRGDFESPAFNGQSTHM